MTVNFSKDEFTFLMNLLHRLSFFIRNSQNWDSRDTNPDFYELSCKIVDQLSLQDSSIFQEIYNRLDFLSYLSCKDRFDISHFSYCDIEKLETVLKSFFNTEAKNDKKKT